MTRQLVFPCYWMLLALNVAIISVYGLTNHVKYGDNYNEEENELDSDYSKDTIGRFPFLMPAVSPQQPELYLCTPIKVDPTTTYYIVGYEPNATMNTAHHMLIYGCGEPGTKKSTWNCGEMAVSNGDEAGSPCGVHSHSQILYAWARDAPKLELPEGVGFKVGKGTDIKYLVLQVHYAHVDRFKDGSTDDSGVFLQYTEQPLQKLAGVLLLGTGGSIPPMAVEHMETACEIEEQKTIYPFAYRTHTHGLGKVVSGYRVRTNDRGVQDWTLLGKRDPMTPQMFYPIEDKSPILYGDHVAARCTMQSNRNRFTEVGSTNEDEMCNFYLMYYMDHEEPLKTKYCFSKGPPTYYWSNPDTGLHNIPNSEASTL